MERGRGAEGEGDRGGIGSGGRSAEGEGDRGGIGSGGRGQRKGRRAKEEGVMGCIDPQIKKVKIK